MSVKKGETICIITAAKVRVDVTSHVNGKIVKILAGEEVEVEPGDPLAEIEAGKLNN
jgi:biotin carboxyl carrier protein